MASKTSSLALVLANMLPLAGVFLFDWNVLDIVVLYWAENVVIGVLNVARMAICEGGLIHPVQKAQLASRGMTEIQAATLSRISGAIKYFLIPFFILHYGMFCFGHLAAIHGILGSGLAAGQSPTAAVFMSWDWAFWLAIGAIFTSHLASFVLNFVGEKEYQRTNLRQLMTRPYGRIVALHLAIIFGAALITWLGSPVYMLVVLVLVKTGIDLRLHQTERFKFSMT